MKNSIPVWPRRYSRLSFSYFMLVVPCIFCCICTTAIAARLGEQKIAKLPEIPVVDYSGVKNRSDYDLLVKALEGTRTAINQAIADGVPYNPDDEFGESKAKSDILKWIGTYVILLQDLGLKQESQKILDVPDYNMDTEYWHLNLPGVISSERRYVKSNSGETSEYDKRHEDIALGSRILYANENSDGSFYLWSNVARDKNDDSLTCKLSYNSQLNNNNRTMNWEASPKIDSTPKCITCQDLRSYAEELLKRFNLTKGDIPRILNAYKEDSPSSFKYDGAYFLGYSIILSELGEPEKAKIALQKGTDLVEKAEKAATSPSEVLKSKEPLLRYYRLTKKYDEMNKLLDEAKVFYEKEKSNTRAAGWENDWNREVYASACILTNNVGIDQGIECAKKTLGDGNQQTTLMQLANYCASNGLKDGMQKIIDLKLTGNRDFKYLYDILEKYDAPPKPIPTDEELKKQLNEKILYSLKDVKKDNYDPATAATLAEYLCMRRKYEMKTENLELIKSLDSPTLQAAVITNYIDRIVSEPTPEKPLDRNEVRSLLNLAYEYTMQAEPNPGHVRVGANFARMTPEYQNEFLWLLISTALQFDYKEEAEKWLPQSRELDAKLPIMNRVKMRKYLHHDGMDFHDTFWANKCWLFQLPKEEKYDSAIIAADQIRDSIGRFGAFRAISIRLINK